MAKLINNSPKFAQGKTVVPWIGGKRRLAKHIIPMFPEHQCYVEPFAGGAALLFMKEPSEVEVLNDINTELINLYRVIKHHLIEFCRQFEWALISRELYSWLRDTPPETLTDVQRAARFYYLQKMGFGGLVAAHRFGTATTSAPRLNLRRIEEDLSAAHLRFSRTYIESLEWSECVRRYDRPHTLFYCDPPYYGTEGYGVEFGLEQYDLMATLAKTIKGKMLISVNDIPEMRKAFAGLNMKRLEIAYTVCGGGRSEKCGELLIWNW